MPKIDCPYCGDEPTHAINCPIGGIPGSFEPAEGLSDRDFWKDALNGEAVRASDIIDDEKRYVKEEQRRAANYAFRANAILKAEMAKLRKVYGSEYDDEYWEYHHAKEERDTHYALLLGPWKLEEDDGEIGRGER